MKIETILKALEYFAMSDDVTKDELADCLDSIKSCRATLERMDDHSIWQDRCTIVLDEAITCMLNFETYDIYGKIRREQGEHDYWYLFDIYCNTCRSSIEYLRTFTNDQLLYGYDLVQDLWRVNEESGDNNPDGTFNRLV